MRYYVEVFNKGDDSLEGYIKTNLTPEQVAHVFGQHPVGCYELCSTTAERLRLEGLDFKSKDYILSAIREYVNEVYEHEGETLYPPPLFLPDSFNANLVRPKPRSLSEPDQ